MYRFKQAVQSVLL